MAEEKKETKHTLKPDEKKLIHQEEFELEKKLRQKVKGYVTGVSSRGRFSDVKRIQRVKTSVRPQRRKG